MKKIMGLLFVLIVAVFALTVAAAQSVSDKDIDAALKKQLQIGKSGVQDCEKLFGKPISVVENAHSVVFAYKLKRVITGLGLDAAAQTNSLSSVSTSLQTSSVAISSAHSSDRAKDNHAKIDTANNDVVKNSGEQSINHKTGNSKTNNTESSIANNEKLKREKEPVDKIINFSFKDNKLLSYKIASSH